MGRGQLAEKDDEAVKAGCVLIQGAGRRPKSFGLRSRTALKGDRQTSRPLSECVEGGFSELRYEEF